MTKTLVVMIAAVVLLAASFLIGYWPQRQARLTAEHELATLRDRVATLEERVATAGLLGQLLTIRDTVAARNLGAAQRLSSDFFDRVREHSSRTRLPGTAPLLQNILGKRDEVISALARGDIAVSTTLRRIEIDLRNGLGFVVPPEATQP